MKLDKHIGLYTDFYELTMAQGYFLSGRQSKRVVFDYFFRKNPYGGGFAIFAGLSDLLNNLSDYRFDDEDLRYLGSLGFRNSFLEYLRSFSFRGNVFSVQEGEVVFPDEPILRVEGNIMEAQVIESLLLNLLNFQSLIATKAARIRLVAGNKFLSDFGLRRAQGLGAIHASRAAIIGGFNNTSNIYAAYHYQLSSGGTMAHSWIQSFDSELKAFRAYAEYYPETAILLVDTYNTLQSGIPNAIKVAKELEAEGNRLVGIRLDSGDLAYLSKAARKMLDDHQLNYVKIAVSNQLDENIIKSLMEQKAPIDIFGVGTALVIGKDEGALDGVYKLAQKDQKPTMKVSENISKMTLPGTKTIYRYYTDNSFYADGIELTGAPVPGEIYHPVQDEKHTHVSHFQYENILSEVMKEGKISNQLPSIEKSAAFAQKRLDHFPEEMKRFDNPHVYKVGLGKELKELRNNLKSKLWKP